MKNKKNIRNFIKQVIKESKLFEALNAEEIEEERITNPEAEYHVKNKENFIGSHIFGEDLGDLGEMYVAYSYGEQFPAYVYHKGIWYHNTDDYLLPDGSANPATDKHKEDMRPTKKTKGISTKQLQSLISKFRRANNLPDISHTSVKPGEKN